jgi:hypothetical protein
MKFDLDAFCEELNLQDLVELCPDEEHKERLVIWTLQLYRSDFGFSKDLKQFIQSRGIPIGAALSKGSPIHLQKVIQPEPETKTMAKSEPEVTPNMELAGALAFVIPELCEVLTRDNAATLNWDGDTLALGDAKPKKDKKPKPTEEEPVKGKGKKEEAPAKVKGKKPEPKEEETLSEEEFNEMLEGDLADTDKLAEFATEMEVTWDENKNEKINRMRIIKAIRAACEWTA